MPFISVIIPVYNVAQYLNRCVDSLLGQEYKDYEIILVDDGSTDGSGKLCDEIAKAHSKIFTVHKDNGGLASARNYGLDYIRGKYVTFIDSDDWVMPDYFEFIEKKLKENKVDILKFGYQRVQNKVPGKVTVPYFEEGCYDREKIESHILPGAIGPIRLFDYSKSALMSACVCAYSTDFLNHNQIRFQSERKILSEDHLFNFTALLLAESVEITHKILYMYDFREGSLTKRYKYNMVERKQRLLQTYKGILLKYNAFEKYSSAYYAQCADGYYACITNECGKWSSQDQRNHRKRVLGILSLAECRTALKKCNHSNLGLKGNIIYWLMRTKQAFLISVFYKLVKN